jgi:hypothetical protein
MAGRKTIDAQQPGEYVFVRTASGVIRSNNSSPAPISENRFHAYRQKNSLPLAGKGIPCEWQCGCDWRYLGN